MVLTSTPGGVAGDGHAPAPGGSRSAGGEAGSQALEFAMVVPLLGLLLGLVIQTGLLLADVVVAQGIAREAGRAAAVDGDDRARQVAERMAGDRQVRVEVDGDAGVVEVGIELATGAFASVGVDLWLPARATFRREAPLGAGLDGG
jgi:Flp pilus assembly protein TadG